MIDDDVPIDIEAKDVQVGDLILFGETEYEVTTVEYGTGAIPKVRLWFKDVQNNPYTWSSDMRMKLSGLASAHHPVV